MKLLLIEDEIDLQDSIKQFLTIEGYRVETVSNYNYAEEKINLYSYDCIIVDISLPDGNGLDIIKALKKNESKSGVIIISAKNSINDKLTGFDFGADDYLTKPFHLSELNARIKSIIRRRKLDGGKNLIFNEITINFDDRSVKINNCEIILTRKEFDLLLYFVTNKNRILSKEMIVEHLWGDDMGISADSFNFIYTHIKNLRKKLLDNGCADYIQTAYGIGYKFTEA